MIVRLLALAACSTALLNADGGAVVFRQQTGAFLVTLFSSPEPLRVGAADLSVLVQRASDQSPLLDEKVNLALGTSAEIPATHREATNKLLYAARVPLTTSGVRHVSVLVNGTVAGGGELNVLPAQPPLLAYWPYFVFVPFVVLLFVLNQILKKRRVRASPHYGR